MKMKPGRRARVLWLLVVPALAVPFAMAAVAVTQTGFRAHSYAGFDAEASGGAITGQKPESKLWFHDGRWWAAMLAPARAGAHTIHRLDGSTWTDTGVVIDPVPAGKEDVASAGGKLYIVSRKASGAGANQFRIFTYSGGAYTLDPGFPVAVAGTGAETTTIARDSAGIFWLTYEAGNQILVARSQDPDGKLWSAPFVLPVTGASAVDSDDIAAIIAFTDSTGPAVGVMWSNQLDQKDYFAVHRDGASDRAWSVETALSGAKEADDHVSLKTFEGRIFSAVKTSKSDSGETLIRLLTRSPAGVWSKHPVALTGEDNTRPITLLEIDPAARQVYVFMTFEVGGSPAGISYKKSPLDAIGFPSEATVFIRGPGTEPISNVTSTKQNLTAASGVVVLASDGTDYWWNRLNGAPTPTPTPTPSGPISLRSASFAANAEEATLEIPTPGGVASGDLLLASVDVRGAPGVTAPAGWTLLRLDSNGSVMRKLTYYRVAGASEPTRYVFGFNAAKAASGGILAYTGVDGAHPIDASEGRVNDAASASIAAPSITTSVGGARIVGLFAIAKATAVAPPSAMTERGEASSTPGAYKITSEAADEPQAAAAPSGGRTATAGVTGASIGQLVALRPAS